MKKRRIVIISIMLALLFTGIYWWNNQSSQLYFLASDKSEVDHLYRANKNFTNIHLLADTEKNDEIGVVEMIAAHTDGETVYLLFRSNGFYQAIGKYSISRKEIVDYIFLDAITREGLSIKFLDWDVSENKLIVVTDGWDGAQKIGFFNVQTIDLTTNDVKKVYTTYIEYYFGHSPIYAYNGKDTVVFNNGVNIYALTISTGEIEFITYGNYPFLTPDGNKVTYFERCYNFHCSVYNINIDTGEKEYINETDIFFYNSGGISWSPDEKYIYYIEARGESDPMFVVRFNTITGRSHKYFQSNKRSTKIHPSFITNIYQ